MSAPDRSDVDHIAGLDADRKLAFEVARHHRHPLRVDALRHVDRRRARLHEQLVDSLVARREHAVAVAADIDDEHAHRDAELLHRVAELLLQFGRAAHHAVVFEGGEAAVGDELELIEQVLARRRPEHAEVGAYFSLNVCLTAGVRGAGRGGLRGRGLGLAAGLGAAGGAAGQRQERSRGGRLLQKITSVYQRSPSATP